MAKRRGQNDKQRSTKYTHKTKDRVTRTILTTGGDLRCSGRVSSSYSTIDTRRVNLVTIPVRSHGRGKDREVLTTSGTYPWSFVTQIFHNGQPSRGGDRTFYPNRNISIFVSVSSFDKEIRIESAQLLFLMCIHRPTERGRVSRGNKFSWRPCIYMYQASK